MNYMKILNRKIFLISISFIVITFLIRNYFPHQVIQYLLYSFCFTLMSLSYFERFFDQKQVKILMFEWIGGLFGLGQNGGFFIFLFIVLCIVGYISSDLDDFSEV